MIIDEALQNLIPADLISEAEKCGIERISVGSWYDPFLHIFGLWRPGSKEIFMDPSRGERLLVLYRVKHPGLDLTMEEAYIFLFFHELAHVNGHKDEKGADEWAVKRFKEWRSETREKTIEIFREVFREAILRE